MFKKEPNLQIVKKALGFTLIELLVVMAVLGVLVTILLVALDPVRLIGQSRDSKRRSDLQQIKVAMQQYYNDCKVYPTDAQVPFTNPPSALGNTGNGVDGAAGTCDDGAVYMKQVPNENGGAYDYRVETVNRQSYEVGANLNYTTTDDNNTRTKCDTTIGGASDYPANTDFV